MYELNKRANSVPANVYEKSHEGLNRDSAINIAKAVCDGDTDTKKPFVFLSASESIFPFLKKYSDMKREAE